MAVYIVNILFLIYCIYLVIYSLFRCCQLVSWWLTGVQGHLKSCRNGDNYESSAQLLRVWIKCTGRIVNVNLRHHFLSTHVRFVHPTYALQKHITLMTVTDTEAIFSISDKNENVFNVRKWPFLFLAQLPTAKYLLIMPISSMIKLGEELGDPKAKVIWIYHTGRCGSTALSQVFNSLPDVVSISEPNCLFTLDQHFKNKYYSQKKQLWTTSEDYLTLYKNTVRLLLKPTFKDANIFAIKSHAYMSKIDIQLIHKLFPSFYEVFMYRGIKEQIPSMYKPLNGGNLQAEISLCVATHPLLSALFPTIRPSSLVDVSCNDPEHLNWLFNRNNMAESIDFIITVIHFAETCFHYKEAAAKGVPVVAVKYEHLQEDKVTFFKALFSHIGLEMTSEKMRLIDEALVEDSQKGSIIDQETMKFLRQTNITPAMIANANSRLQYYDLPNWDESLLLPNTISKVLQ
ncbi:hypothetical protein EB796_008369 [Bugula neritina]|uniref:Sulfotransferase domain-containing protein n=1 Tax=Bugula neritina TaxID=10212 RepID=A0A7J7K563_BUGNE|nr:hypothetical protein EB796_008369 [Bugula neritina]